MKCPFCNETDTKVIDKREAGDAAIRRRRECLECGKRYTTYERIETPELKILKKDGRKEDFNREKLKKGILRAVEKRPVTDDQVEYALDSIETRLRNAKSIDIPSKKLGEFVMKELKKLDKVAYIRFASVYKEFADIDDFKNELRELIKR